MERRLKERLTGAAVLVMIAVIFIPMILDNPDGNYSKINETNIPPLPDTDFGSSIIPLQETAVIVSPDTTNNIQSPDIAEINTPGVSDSPGPEQTTRSPAPPQTRPAEAVSSVSKTPPGPVQTGPVDAEPRGLTAWVVQLGSFSNHDNANGLVGRLQGGGYPAYIEEIQAVAGGTIFRVRVGPELSKTDADKILKDLKEKFALEGILLPYP